jgi:hypothetical protein
MKKWIPALAVLPVAGILWIAAPCGNEALAISGCCKERKDDGYAWKKNGQSFAKCQASNKEKDEGDNIMQRKGRVWWDVGC